MRCWLLKKGAKKGAYFFVLDAFVAGIIVVSTLSVIFGSFGIADNPRQNYVLAEDFMKFLESTQIKSYAGDARYELEENGNITDTSLTLLEQVVLFYDTNPSLYPSASNNAPAAKLLHEISSLAPENNGIAFYIVSANGDETELFSNTLVVNGEESRVQLVATRIITTRESMTPYAIEVRLWQ